MRAPTKPRNGGDVEVQMTAMIDVVFLLLIFFLSASAFSPLEYDLASGLAAPLEATPATAAKIASDAASPLTPHLDDLMITLRPGASGQAVAWLHDQAVTKVQLRTQLAAIGALGVQPIVIIRPLGEITMGEAIEVFDTAKQTGLQDVRWAVAETNSR